MSSGAPHHHGIAVRILAQAVAGAAGSMFAVVTAVVVSRSLGPEAAGRYFLCVAAATIVAQLSELGADTGLVRFVAATRAGPGRVPSLLMPSVLMRSAFRAVGLAACGVLALGLVMSWTGRTPDGAPSWLVPVMAAGAGSAALLAVALAVTRGFGDSVTYPLVHHVLLPATRASLVTAVLLIGGSAAGAVAAWSGAVVVAAVGCGWWVWTRYGRVSGAGERVDAGLLQEFWRFSRVRGLSAGVEILLEWGDVLLVGLLAGPADAGVYAVLTRCVRAGDLVLHAARLVLAPVVSAAAAAGEGAAVALLHARGVVVVVWLVCPFYLLLSLYPEAVLNVFGTHYPTGAVGLMVLAGSLTLASTAGAVSTVILMAGRGPWQLFDKAVALGVLVALDVALIPRAGVTGAALAWAAAILVDTALQVWQVSRHLGVAVSSPLLRAAMAVVGLGAAVPTLIVRLAAGDEPPSLAMAIGVLIPTHLTISWVFRRRLGFTPTVVHHRVRPQPTE